MGGVGVVVLGVMIVPAAISQMEPTPRVYTFVSQFQGPRANWAQYSEENEKTIVPIAEKMLADGSIVSWATFENVGQQPGGYTAGSAGTSAGTARIMNVP